MTSIILKVVLAGVGAVGTLFALFATGAAAIALEPLLWWLFMGEAIVLLGLFLRLYHAMKELGSRDE